MSATQFAYDCLGRPGMAPPEPKRGRALHGADELCWLCGGPTDGLGWPERGPFGATFTNVNMARVPTSQTVCRACVYLSTGAGWQEYARRHPELPLKTAHPLSWRSYSHAFSRAGHECPQRARWRALLVEPPEPPFVFAIAESGQKHILFRAAVAHDRDTYPVQVEEDTLSVKRHDLTACFAAFETLYALGFSKEQIATGRYHPAQTLKVGPAVWRVAERVFAPWRARRPDLVRLCAFCAQRSTEDA